MKQWLKYGVAACLVAQLGGCIILPPWYGHHRHYYADSAAPRAGGMVFIPGGADPRGADRAH